jgi:hypothetical protein
MLIRRAVLDRIAAGEITLAFRRWRRPTVRPGGQLHTAAGLLAIDSVDLAARLDQPTPAFKANARKLKALGLTESLEVGYRLSPRGRALLTRLTRRG